MGRQMKVGNTIKCNSMTDMWNTKHELERCGIYADIKFPVSDFTLVVWKIKENDDDQDWIDYSVRMYDI